jgi:diguanylate cyclase (GGDEF)-like protein
MQRYGGATEGREHELVGSEEVQRQIQALSSRDLQLWSIGILVMLVLSAGFLAVVFPNLQWHPEVNFNGRLLPQFFFGLITLIVLFNVYIIHQKRVINSTRHELIRELVYSERMESLTLLDPATQLFNRRGVDQMLAQEVHRANRMGSNLTLLLVKVESLPVVKQRYGAAAADKFIAEIARVLRNTFRGSDILCRYSDDEFLAMLPGTSEVQAEQAIRRVQEAADHWNLTSKTGWEIHLVWGIAPYVPGGTGGDLLKAVERKILPQRQKLVPVFVPVSSDSGDSTNLLV